MSNRKDRTQALAARSRFRMDDLQVQPDRLVVIRDGAEIKLELRMMEVLVFLAEHSGETMSTERLLIEIWEGAFYGDNPVNKTISVLRSRIGDDTHKPRYIETIPKIGYRVIAPVTLPEDYRRTPSDSDRWTHGSPYMGLSAFDAPHAKVFCGRSRMLAELLAAMRSQVDNKRRFILMVGPSGCGKTSLLRAGAIPLLTKANGFDGLHAVSTACCDLAAANGGDVMKMLAEALATWRVNDRPVLPPLTTEQLKSALTNEPESIFASIDETFRRLPGRPFEERPYAHLLLTVDHAEALVATNEIDAEARDAYMRALQALCASPHTLTMMATRIDFYPKLMAALPMLAECKAGDGHFEVFAPREGEIAEAIRTPAWKANLSFEKNPETLLRLDDAVRDAVRMQPDVLPLLQHTLQMLYERRRADELLTFEAYDAIGGLEGAIAHRAEEVFSSLPSHVRESLDAVLGRLIVVQTDSDAVSARRVDTEEFDGNVTDLVDAFIDARLFVGGLRDGRPTVGVAHEALLRRWPRVMEWVQENQRLLQAKARLERASCRWIESGRRQDHLLNPGQPLVEAQEVEDRFPVEISANASLFLRTSGRADLMRRRIRMAAMAAFVALGLAAMTFALIAVQARHAAEKREREARRLTDYMLGSLADELRQREILGLLGTIGKQAIAYLEDHNPKTMSQAERISTARGYRTAGEALMETKSRREAEASFERAYRFATIAIDSDPRDQNAYFERGNAAYWKGKIHYDEKRYAAAEADWKQYLRDSVTLTNLDEKSPVGIQEVGYAQNVLGTLALRQGDLGEAITLFEKSTESKKRLLSIDKDNLSYRFDYIDSNSWISSTLEAQGSIQSASSQYDEQITQLNALITGNKTAGRWRSRLANYEMLSANLEIGRNNLRKAESLASDAVRILEQLELLSPENEGIAIDLAKARLILAETLALSGKSGAAGTRLQSVVATFSELGPEAKESTAWRWVEVRARFALSMLAADIYPNSGADLAIEDMTSLTKIGQSEDMSEHLAYALLLRGISHARHGRKDLSRRDCEAAIRIIDNTHWRHHPFRSWVWSEAKAVVGDATDASETRRWLDEIGYSRRR